jgi:hypothetical protein
MNWRSWQTLGGTTAIGWKVDVRSALGQFRNFGSNLAITQRRSSSSIVSKRASPISSKFFERYRESTKAPIIKPTRISAIKAFKPVGLSLPNSRKSGIAISNAKLATMYGEPFHLSPLTGQLPERQLNRSEDGRLS